VRAACSSIASYAKPQKIVLLMANCWQWLSLPNRRRPVPRTNAAGSRSGGRRPIEPLGLFRKGLERGGTVQGNCRFIIVALDYKGSGYELNCTVDGDNMHELARQCGIEDVSVAYNQSCTPAKFKELFNCVGARCQPDDTLLFYFAGHGTCLKDLDGDGNHDMDEAFVLVNDSGELDLDTAVITHDEFVAIIVEAVPPQTTIITLCDCCHSGTIVGFNRGVWNNWKAVSVSGFRDAQTSGDREAAGGICTHSILLAVESLQRQGLQHYPVKKLFKETLVQDEAVFSSDQDITLNRSAGCLQQEIPWPLIPKIRYTAPYHQRPSPTATPSSSLHGRDDVGDMNSLSGSTQTLPPVTPPVPALHRLPKLDIRRAATQRSSSSPRPLEPVNPRVQEWPLPPHVLGGGVACASAAMGVTAFMDSQPPFTARPKKFSASVSSPVRAPLTARPKNSASVSIPVGAQTVSTPDHHSLPAAWPPTGPAIPQLPGFHALKASQHSSCPSLRKPLLRTLNVSPRKHEHSISMVDVRNLASWRFVAQPTI